MTQPRVVVFCGPTISADAVRQRVDADCLGPVAQGDVLRALANRPSVVAIVDGYFDRVPSVWHKEILFAMARGAHVLGAASMGALRACELDRYGMIGVGEVYAQFRDGKLTDDDEVAVVHGTEETGYAPLSTAMVDLRDCFVRAERAGIVSTDEARRLVETGKAMHYTDRALPSVLHRAAAAGVRPAVCARLEAFAAAAGPLVKERDARLLIDAISDFVADPPPPLRVDWSFHRTVFFDALMNETDRQVTGRDANGNAEAALVQMGAGTPSAVRREVLLGVLARREADRLGITLTADETEECITAFRRRHRLLAADDTVRWLDEVGLDWPDFVDGVTGLALVSKLERVYRFEVDGGVAAHTRLQALANASERRRGREDAVVVS